MKEVIDPRFAGTAPRPVADGGEPLSKSWRQGGRFAISKGGLRGHGSTTEGNRTVPTAVVKTAIFACLASIASFGATLTFHLLVGLKEPNVAFALSTLCPLAIAPPLMYSAFRNSDRIATLNLELAAANAELAEAKQSLEAMVRIDKLTGLLNRGTFFDALASASAATGGTFLMIDVDHFKEINDRYGHAAGDDVLVLIGRLLSGTLSSGGFAGRVGGEEFALFFPGLALSQAMPLAEALRQQVVAEIAGGAGLDHAVTVSIGAAEVGKGDDGAEVYRASDAALYRAKHAGRNRVEAA
ncbi:MAG: GGDEF domain-containing protein [Phreatobacter sp.]|nr:GGDEF domain-containing protein [Phreatobacter sp.]